MKFWFRVFDCFLCILTWIIRTCDDHRRLFVFAIRGNLVPDANLFLTSMFLVVYNLNSGDCTVARQLNFIIGSLKFKLRTNQL